MDERISIIVIVVMMMSSIIMMMNTHYLFHVGEHGIDEEVRVAWLII